jgi:hypothetical protein
VALLDAVSVGAGTAATLLLGVELLFEAKAFVPELTAVLAGAFCDPLPLFAIGREIAGGSLSGRLVFAAEVEFAGVFSRCFGALSNDDGPGIFSSFAVFVVCAVFSLVLVEFGEAGAFEAACFAFSGSIVAGCGPALAAT